MTLDNQTLIFNLDKTFNLFNLSAKQFDTDNARSFTFQFIQNNTPFSLNGITVKVGGVKPDGKKIFNDVQIIDSTNGIVELDLTSQMLAANGVLKLEFIFMKNNIRLSSYPFEINIVPSVTNFNAIESSDEFGALTNALGSVEGTINNLTNSVNSAIVDVKANQIGGTNLLDNTDLANPIQMFNNTPNIQLIVDETFQRQTSIYNEKLLGLQSSGNSFGDSYTSLFKTNDKIIQPDTTYTISFNYMSLHAAGDINSSCFLYLNKNDGTQEVLYMDVDLASHGENWFKYVKTFTTPANIRNIEVRFGFRCTAFAWLAIDGLKLEKGSMATDWSTSPFDWKNEVQNCEPITSNTKEIESCRTDINNNTKQIASNSSAIQDLKNSWFSTGNNSLCINGRNELDVYPGGVYFINGTSVTELHTITHSHLEDGQSVFFIAETIDQTANIKFCHDDLVHCQVYTPKGQDFWITGRDNGDTIFEMKKMSGALRFVGMV